MDATNLSPSDSQPAPGIVMLKRSTPAFLAKFAREPLSTLPAASYGARMVVTQSFGHLRTYISDPVLIHEAIVRNADRLDKDRGF